MTYAETLRIILKWSGRYEELRHNYRLRGAESFPRWLGENSEAERNCRDIADRWIEEEGGWEAVVKAVFEDTDPSVKGSILAALAGVRTPIGGGFTPIGDAG